MSLEQPKDIFEIKGDDHLITIECRVCGEEIAVFGPGGTKEKMEEVKEDHRRVCFLEKHLEK